MYLIIMVTNGIDMEVFQCKTLSDAIDLAHSQMEDVCFDISADIINIFKPVPRQQTCELIMDWRGIYPNWERENG